MSKNAIVKIYRFDPTSGESERYDTYEVPPEGWVGLRVLDTLKYIYEKFDSGLSFRESCYQRLCGACTMRINNKTVLACDVESTDEMVIEPVPGKRIIKDLVVDLENLEK